MTGDQVLASPYFLIGSRSAIPDDVLALRERHGISYLTFFPATSNRSRLWLPSSPAAEVSAPAGAACCQLESSGADVLNTSRRCGCKQGERRNPSPEGCW